MLIMGTHGSPDGLRVHARVRLEKKVYLYACFLAGIVVVRQLQAQRFFPVWARLSMVKGKAHEYYKLDLATTIAVCGGGDPAAYRWRLNYDLETNIWTNEP
jgi:hypothetical protein